MGKTVAYLKPNPTVAIDEFDMDDTDEEQKIDVSKVATAQAHYHRLKLVCSKFKQVFQEHSELSDEIILAEGNRSHMVPNALVWLRQSGSAIRNFTAFYRGPIQDLVLAAMASSSPQLDYVHVSGPLKATLSGLLAFKSLKCCHLVKPAKAVSLYPLRSLQCLESLFLQSGTFNRLAIPCCVTSLIISRSTVNCAQDWCSINIMRLQSLAILSSKVSSLHDLGLLTCTLLHHLDLGACVVTAADPINEFAVGLQTTLCIPTVTLDKVVSSGSGAC